MDDLSLSYAQMGIILGSWQLVYIFYAQVAGLLVDRMGPYRSLFLGATIIALSSALRWFAGNFVTLLLTVALFGLGGPLISIGLPKLASFWFVGKERGTASGIYTTGPIIGGIVTLSITRSVVLPLVSSWRNVFVVYSLVGLLIVGFWIVFGRKFPNEANQVAEVEQVRGERTWNVIKRLFKIKKIWLIVIIGVSSFLTSHGLSNWLPKILELKGLPPTEAGLVVSFLSFCAIFGSIIIPRLPYYLGSRKRAISLTLFTNGLAILVLGLVNGLPMWIAIALVGLTRGLFPLLTVALMDMPEVGPQRMGVVGGLFFSVGEIGGFGGPFIMGVLKDVTGVFLSGIIFLVIVTECSILCAVLLKADKSLAH
jgi:cyanate permease